METFSDPSVFRDADPSPKRRFPLVPIAGAFGVLVVVVGIVYFSGADVRAARKAVAGIPPEQMAEKLFANEELPDCIALEVKGVLDLRLNQCEYEFYDVGRTHVRKLKACRVYGLLYPSGSPVASGNDQITSLAEEVKAYADAGEVDTEEYCDLWEELSATYEELAEGKAVLVELDPERYPALYRDAEEESLILVNNRGRMLAPGTIAVGHRNMANRLLDPAYLIEGTFKVQIIEHNAGVAGAIQNDDFTRRVQVVRTVKGPR